LTPVLYSAIRYTARLRGALSERRDRLEAYPTLAAPNQVPCHLQERENNDGIRRRAGDAP